MPAPRMDTPEWLYQAIQNKFPDYPELVKKDSIGIMKISGSHLRQLGDVLAAFVNLDMKDGIFLLYEADGDGYKEVYEKRLPVIGVQAYWDTNIVFTARLGSGTGYWTDQHFLIRHTDRGYKEVWSDTAQLVKMHPEDPPGIQITGSVSFDSPDRMVYFQLKRLFSKTDFHQPYSLECKHHDFHFGNLMEAIPTRGGSLMNEYSFPPLRQLNGELYAYVPPYVLSYFTGMNIETSVKGFGEIGARMLPLKPDGRIPLQIYKFKHSLGPWTPSYDYREFHYSEILSVKPDPSVSTGSPAGQYRPIPLLGLTGLLTVIASYIAYDEFLKYRALIVRCMYDNPYQWDKMEQCLKSNGVDGPAAANIVSTIKMVYFSYLKAKSIIPNPSGKWQTTIGNKTGTMTFKLSRTIGDETVVEGTYCCNPSGTLEGTLMLGTLTGTWEDKSGFIEGKPKSGGLKFQFDYDDQGNPIFRGTFGFGQDNDTFHVTGRQISEDQN